MTKNLFMQDKLEEIILENADMTKTQRYTRWMLEVITLIHYFFFKKLLITFTSLYFTSHTDQACTLQSYSLSCHCACCPCWLRLASEVAGKTVWDLWNPLEEQTVLTSWALHYWLASSGGHRKVSWKHHAACPWTALHQQLYMQTRGPLWQGRVDHCPWLSGKK